MQHLQNIAEHSLKANGALNQFIRGEITHQQLVNQLKAFNDHYLEKLVNS